MARNDDLLLGDEVNAPALMQRFTKLMRQHKGANARRNTKASREWFYKNLTKRSEISADKVMREWTEKTATSSGLIGKLYLFKYDAKHKDTLDYWDSAPLTLFFNSFVGDGQYGEQGVQYLIGINFHYMPPKVRLKVLELLLKLRSEKRYRASTRLKVTWNALKQLGNNPAFEHAVKMYRADHVRSKLHEIHPGYYEQVIFLPIAEFQKGTNRTVWSDIGKKKKRKA